MINENYAQILYSFEELKNQFCLWLYKDETKICFNFVFNILLTVRQQTKTLLIA